MIRLRSSAVSRPQLLTSASRPVESASDSASSCVGNVVFSERYRGGSSPSLPTIRLYILSVLFCKIVITQLFFGGAGQGDFGISTQWPVH